MEAIAAVSPKNVPIRAFPGDPLFTSSPSSYDYFRFSLPSAVLTGELTTVVRVTADEPQVLARMRVRLQRLFAGEKMVVPDSGQVLWHECFANKETVGELEQVGKVQINNPYQQTSLVTYPNPAYLTHNAIQSQGDRLCHSP